MTPAGLSRHAAARSRDPVGRRRIAPRRRPRPVGLRTQAVRTRPAPRPHASPERRRRCPWTSSDDELLRATLAAVAPGHRAARRPRADPARPHRRADRARPRPTVVDVCHRRLPARRRVLRHPAARAGQDGRRDRPRPRGHPHPARRHPAAARPLDRDRPSPAPGTAPPSGWPSRPASRSISVSQSMRIIALYVGGRRHVLEDSGAILSRANQALPTLERYKSRLDEVTGTLSALEIEDLVTVRDVAAVLQRLEMVRRIADEIDDYVVELGTDGRLLTLQLEELIGGVGDDRELVIRDYLPRPRAARTRVEEVLADLMSLVLHRAARPRRRRQGARLLHRRRRARRRGQPARLPAAVQGPAPARRHRRPPGRPLRQPAEAARRQPRRPAWPSRASARAGPAPSARACPAWPSPASSSATSEPGAAVTADACSCPSRPRSCTSASPTGTPAPRRDLPWRAAGATPWGVLVSEVMLAADAGRPGRAGLAASGCGAGRRPADLAAGRSRRRGARLGPARLPAPGPAPARRGAAIVRAPRRPGARTTHAELLALPGVGAYTAAAVASFAFGAARHGGRHQRPPGARPPGRGGRALPAPALTRAETSAGHPAAARGPRRGGHVERRGHGARRPGLHGPLPALRRLPRGRPVRVAARRPAGVRRPGPPRAGLARHRPAVPRRPAAPCCGPRTGP